MSCTSDKLHKWQIFSLCNTRYCVVHVIIITFWIITIQVLICHIYATYIHTHTHTHTHAHTHNTHIYTHIHTHKCKIMSFNENIRSNKDYGQIERKKLKYLHYLNNMIQKCKTKKFIFSEVSCFKPELFQRFHLDFKGLHSSYGMQ